MIRGTCARCLKETDLRLSHYLPKALYKILSAGAGELILSAPNVTIQKDTQVTKHLLCSSCEQLFSKNGEHYATSLVRGNGSFPILDLVRSCSAGRMEGEFNVYRATDLGVNAAALAYFALSVLWRGAFKWQALKQTRIGGLHLGAHKEAIREYLLGTRSFPQNVVVKVSVAEDAASQLSIKFPEKNPNHIDASVFTFRTLGIWYDIAVGDPLPKSMAASCCVNSPENPIFVGDFGTHAGYDVEVAKRASKRSSRLRLSETDN
jgi:hypothetical protein